MTREEELEIKNKFLEQLCEALKAALKGRTAPKKSLTKCSYLELRREDYENAVLTIGLALGAAAGPERKLTFNRLSELLEWFNAQELAEDSGEVEVGK